MRTEILSLRDQNASLTAELAEERRLREEEKKDYEQRLIAATLDSLLASLGGNLGEQAQYPALDETKVSEWWTKEQADQAVRFIVECTSLVPALVGIIKEYVIGYIYLGALVDVRDQIGKWVFGQIREIEGESIHTKDEVPISFTPNCPNCKALFKEGQGPECSVCGAVVQSTAVTQLGPQTPVGTTRCKIAFFGWPTTFDEWVSLDRVRPGATEVRSWLTIGNVICYCHTENAHGEASRMDKYLMARVVELRESPEHGLDVKVQVDMSIPYSFSSPLGHPTPIAEELAGFWLPLTSGRILENGSFSCR